MYREVGEIVVHAENGLLVESWVRMDFLGLMQQVFHDALNNVAPAIEVRTRGLYNAELDYRDYMVPGILVALVTLIGTLLSAQNIAREKELGTLEQLNVTPYGMDWDKPVGHLDEAIDVIREIWRADTRAQLRIDGEGFPQHLLGLRRVAALGQDGTAAFLVEDVKAVLEELEVLGDQEDETEQREIDDHHRGDPHREAERPVRPACGEADAQRQDGKGNLSDKLARSGGVIAR